MGHEDHGLALVAEQPQQVVLELAADLLVDRRKCLVHQQDVGVHREGPGEADATRSTRAGRFRWATQRVLWDGIAPRQHRSDEDPSSAANFPCYRWLGRGTWILCADRSDQARADAE